MESTDVSHRLKYPNTLFVPFTHFGCTPKRVQYSTASVHAELLEFKRTSLSLC